MLTIAEDLSLLCCIPEVVTKTIMFILDVPVGPIGSDGVPVKKTWGPGFVPSLPGLFPLSFFEHKLLLCGPQLVPIFDSTGHVLPKSDGSK